MCYNNYIDGKRLLAIQSKIKQERIREVELIDVLYHRFERKIKEKKSKNKEERVMRIEWE